MRDLIEHCNLLIRPGRPGYDQMWRAAQERKIDYYREEKDGILVNLAEFFRICGERKIR